MSCLIFNQKNLKKAHDFYEKHGPKAVTLCRFIPFFRTYIPFVAGMAEMKWRTFLPWSILGGTGWVFGCVLAGFFFGNIPFIKNNFELVVLSIITSSVVPVAIEFWKKLAKCRLIKVEVAIDLKYFALLARNIPAVKVRIYPWGHGPRGKVSSSSTCLGANLAQ